jgi:hypothetical protein
VNGYHFSVGEKAAHGSYGCQDLRPEGVDHEVGDDVSSGGQPGFVVVSSNEVPVTWWQFVIINPWGAARG